MAVVLLIGGWLLWRLQASHMVEVTQPSRGPAVQAVYATGTVEAGTTIRIAPQQAGRIVELKADEGNAVKTGDVLARLDDSDKRAAAAELDARLKYAEQQFERINALVKGGWVTRDKLDQARSEMNAARHAAQRTKEQLGFMTLKAPADGRVIRRDGEVGDYIPINQTVFYLAKAGEPRRITADVDEEDIPLVKTGQKVLIRSDAFPDQVFKGIVAEITPKGDPVARSYRVRITLPAETVLRIGMTAETNIITKEKKNALQVPSSAIVANGHNTGQAKSAHAALWLVRDGHLVRQPVEVGIRGRMRTEIVQGLGDEDLVVATPAQDLQEGTSVNTKLKATKPAPAPAPGAAKNGTDQ
ncbi:MAG: efflux RND transporter periplasmic adaptor subunit [Alphaproteobacteria bacterium]